MAGASGLIYFMGDPAERGHWLQMQQLNAEFAALESVLLSATPAPEARCSSGAIRFQRKSDIPLSIDLHGSRVEEGVERLEKFMDDDKKIFHGGEV